MFTDNRDVRGHKCGRKITDEGMCGLHLAAQRKRRSNAAARDQQQREDDDRRAAAQSLCDRLAAMGIDATPHFSAGIGVRHTGKIVVSNPEALLATLNLIDMSVRPSR